MWTERWVRLAENSLRIASLSVSLPFTGERFTPEIEGAIWYEHWHRYCAVLPAVVGKRVLDCACGEGYGSMLLAGVAAVVTGIDINCIAIRHATSRYGKRANLRFVQGSCVSLPLADESIDIVISFETIEHIAEQNAMLAEFRRVLVPEGILAVSSPNKPVYSGETGYVNEYHVRELTREELKSMLDAPFPQQAWYGQRVLAHSMLWAENSSPERVADLVALTVDGVQALDAPAPALYFLVVCGGHGAALPRLPALSLFDDGAQSLYRDYERALLAEKRAYWDVADARKIAEERLQEAIVVVNDLASTRQREETLRAHLAEAERERARAAAAIAEANARLRYRESWQGWLRWPLGRLRRRMIRPSEVGGRSR
ncbi:MAG TPA: class I SAM-dependent methyltransferase [Candidatus Binatia bacterium]